MSENMIWDAATASAPPDSALEVQPDPTPAVQETDAPAKKAKRKAANIQIAKLHPFEGHPYRVEDDEDMAALVESIREQGILFPLLARPMDGREGEYEVISGHRRLHAAELLGMKHVPVMIEFIDRDTAAIEMVDSNLHREKILPSERAFAFKIKMEALKHQGKVTSVQLAPKQSAEQIGEEAGMSKDMVKRYIRLTCLIPELLALVDAGKIAMMPAVELSYLPDSRQRELLTTIESEDCTPSFAQAKRLKQLHMDGELDMDAIFAIMTQPKGNQKEKLTLEIDSIRRYFPQSYTPKEMQEKILKLLEADRKRQLDKGARG